MLALRKGLAMQLLMSRELMFNTVILCDVLYLCIGFMNNNNNNDNNLISRVDRSPSAFDNIVRYTYIAILYVLDFKMKNSRGSKFRGNQNLSCPRKNSRSYGAVPVALLV